MKQNKNDNKPRIGITVGDFNGIGPEVILKSLSDQRLLDHCTPVVYGSPRIFNFYKKQILKNDFGFNQISEIKQLNPKRPNLINCLADTFEIEPGKVDPKAGECAVLSLQAAVKDLKDQSIDALVTAPINKKNVQSEAFAYPGHTEYLSAEFDGIKNMILMISDQFRIGTVTGHIPLNKVAEFYTKELLSEKLNILINSLKHDFGIIKPKIAVLGINPHAGDDGLLGDEEQKIINPVLESFRERGHIILGPFSSDGFFAHGGFKNYDAVLAAYHDQGLIPFKVLSFGSGVNFTAGLPVIRTSPDHGTAYDIAGKNLADESSFRTAVFKACDILKTHRENSEYERDAFETIAEES